MASVYPFYRRLGLDLRQLSRGEIVLLEAWLFRRICAEVGEVLAGEAHSNHRDVQFLKKENFMLDAKFMGRVVNDILKTEEYNITGMACYSGVPDDVIFDLAGGYHLGPSFQLGMKIIELHFSARPALYSWIMDKIRAEIQAAA